MSTGPAFNFKSVDHTDAKFRSKSGGSFGLNSAVFFTKLEFNPNAGKDNTPADALDVSIKIGERDFNSRIYNPVKLYDDGEEVDQSSPKFQKLYDEEMAVRLAVINQFVVATGVPQAQIDAALAHGINNFADWVKAITNLVTPQRLANPIDVFLEYQWEIKGDNDRTYLQLPKNLKGGVFCVSHVAPVGEWKEERVNGALVYKDNAGNQHPFDRDKTFMSSAKANQQKDGDDNEAESGEVIAGTGPVPDAW